MARDIPDISAAEEETTDRILAILVSGAFDAIGSYFYQDRIRLNYKACKAD